MQSWLHGSSSLRGSRGFQLLESWKTNTIQSAVLTFAREDVEDVPLEYMELYLNIDASSLEHLWIKIMRKDCDNMDIAHIRLLVETLLTDRCQVKLSPTDYSNWVGELVLLLNGDETTGSVSKKSFLKLFGLWYCSRLWFVPVRRSPVGHILNAWNFVDVSDCGVVMIESITRYLLPYAFRVLFPHDGTDSTDLKDRWIELVKPQNPLTKAAWINHWSEFEYLNPLIFADSVESGANHVFLARQAIASLGLRMDEQLLMDLDSLFTLAPATPQGRSRVFALWLVTLRHSKSVYFPESPANRTTEPLAVIRSLDSFQASCVGIWYHLFGVHPSSPLPEAQRSVLEQWTWRLFDSVNLGRSRDDVVVLRSELCDRFLTRFEVETIWTRFGANKQRLRRADLRMVLTGVYHYAGFRDSDPGPYIIEAWMYDFVEIAKFLFEQVTDPYITKAIFFSVFPLVCASVRPPRVTAVDAQLADIWPDNGKILFSEPLLRNLLREVWEKVIPAHLNMPVQDWWIERCAQRLVQSGRGVSRSMFYSLFITSQEMDRIIASVNRLDPATVLRLLSNCVLDNDGLIPTDWVEEFYLLSDFNVHQDDIKGFQAVTRDQFRLSFPLWVAAHGGPL